MHVISIVSNMMVISISEILASSIMQQQMQQNMFGQAAMKENHFVLKAKRTWTIIKRVRSCWEKKKRTN